MSAAKIEMNEIKQRQVSLFLLKATKNQSTYYLRDKETIKLRFHRFFYRIANPFTYAKIS